MKKSNPSKRRWWLLHISIPLRGSCSPLLLARKGTQRRLLRWGHLIPISYGSSIALLTYSSVVLCLWDDMTMLKSTRPCPTDDAARNTKEYVALIDSSFECRGRRWQTPEAAICRSISSGWPVGWQWEWKRVHRGHVPVRCGKGARSDDNSTTFPRCWFDFLVGKDTMVSLIRPHEPLWNAMKFMSWAHFCAVTCYPFKFMLPHIYNIYIVRLPLKAEPDYCIFMRALIGLY